MARTAKDRASPGLAINPPLGMGMVRRIEQPYRNSDGRQGRRATPLLASVVANDLATSNPRCRQSLTRPRQTPWASGSRFRAAGRGRSRISPEAAAETFARNRNPLESLGPKTPREVDISGRFDMHGLAAAAYRSALLNGEIVATLDWQAFRGAATRTKIDCSTRASLTRRLPDFATVGMSSTAWPSTKRGRVAGYYLRELPLGATFIQPMAKFVPAFTAWGRRKVIHLFELKTLRQYAGLSLLSARLTPAQERESNAEFTLANALLQTHSPSHRERFAACRCYGRARRQRRNVRHVRLCRRSRVLVQQEQNQSGSPERSTILRRR